MFFFSLLVLHFGIVQVSELHDGLGNITVSSELPKIVIVFFCELTLRALFEVSEEVAAG